MTTNKKTVALVTGASSGIGRAIALRLGRENNFVLAHFHKNRAGAEETVRLVASAGGAAEAIGFDVKDGKAIESHLNDWFGANSESTLGALVNNAGVHVDNLAGLLSDEAFDEVLKTNTYGPFYLMRYCVRKMLRQRSGAIVNVSSLSGQTGNAGQINYSASKAALIAMTKTLAIEVGPRGIRVNAVAPGLIETEMLSGVPNLEVFKERIPLRRLGRPEEVASVVAFLLSNEASYVTGHTLSINGGLFPS